MRAVAYWFVRVMLYFCVVLALWVVGWRHWTVALGALILSSLIAYASFGSKHDAFALWAERYVEKRFPPRNKRSGDQA